MGSRLGWELTGPLGSLVPLGGVEAPAVKGMARAARSTWGGPRGDQQGYLRLLVAHMSL